MNNFSIKFLAKSVLLGTFLLCWAALFAWSANPRFASFDFPLAGVTNTQATAITPSGTIVGRYLTPDGQRHGFRLADGRFRSIDVPGGWPTDVTWINPRGDIVGCYDSNGKTYAYVLRDGHFNTIAYPGAQMTLGWGISNGGDVVGPEFNGDFYTAHGYIYHNDTFTLFDVPGARATWPTAAIDSQHIAGNYFGPDWRIHGFVFREGRFTSIDFPGSDYIWITGSNPQGQVVGFYFDALGNQHGFVMKKGKFTSIDIPRAIATEVNGIDPKGNVVGRYTSPDGITHAFFLLDPTKVRH